MSSCSRPRSAGVGSASGERPAIASKVQAVLAEVAERVVADHDGRRARSRSGPSAYDASRASRSARRSAALAAYSSAWSGSTLGQLVRDRVAERRRAGAGPARSAGRGRRGRGPPRPPRGPPRRRAAARRPRRRRARRPRRWSRRPRRRPAGSRARTRRGRPGRSSAVSLMVSSRSCGSLPGHRQVVDGDPVARRPAPRRTAAGRSRPPRGARRHRPPRPRRRPRSRERLPARSECRSAEPRRGDRA